MRRTLLCVVAAVTSLLAIVNALFILVSPDGATLWNVARFVVSVFILSLGILTWRHVRTARVRGDISRVLCVCAVALIGLSVVGTGLAIYNGQRTGDFEYYLFPIHWLVFGQGMLTLGHLRQIGEHHYVQ